ncbi:MAG: caspase family protein [Polyangiaceae bacterium]|nr:caspase family protein [Polyangiaceae bacterium]
MMRHKTVFSLAALIAALCASCSSGTSEVPPPAQAPTQVAACLTFVLEDAPPPPNMNTYDLQTIGAVKKAIVAELVAAGFAIVESRDKPFDVMLKLEALPGSRIETNAQIKAKFSIEGTSGPIDSVDAAAPADAPGAIEAVAASLVDGLFRSANLGGYIKQLRRPGSTGLARTSLRNMAPTCEGFVVPATSASASAPVPTASAVATQEPAPPPVPALLAGSPQPDSFAIVFGVEQYKSGASAPGAKSDAEKMAQVVTRTLGVPDAHVKTAFDTKADRLAIDLNVEWLKLNVPKGGRVYFYFAGLGTGGKAPGSAALLPYDGDAKTGAKTIGVTALMQQLSETKAADSFLIVDASFGGGGGRSVPSGEGPLFSVKNPLAIVRTVYLGAASSAEGARVSADGGVYTKYLIEGLARGHADANADGRVTLLELSQWVTPRVARAGKAENKPQNPSLIVGPAVLPVEKLAIAAGLETP